MLLLQLQKSLEEIGSNIIVTTDSSTPDRAVVFGTYYSGFSTKRGTWESIKLPNENNNPELVEEFIKLENPSFPITNEFDVELSKHVDFRSIEKEKEEAYRTGMRLHNFEFFKDTIDKLESIIYGHDFILEQATSFDTYKLLHSVDEMIKSDNPKQVFEKYKQLYTKLSNMKKEDQIKTHSFF